MQKFRDFSATLILREIDFGLYFRSAKCAKVPKIEKKAAVLGLLDSSKWISRKIRMTRKILKFPHFLSQRFLCENVLSYFR